MCSCGGVYYFCEPFKTEIEEWTKEFRVYSLLRLSNGNLLVGFDGFGIAYLSPDGKLLRHFGEYEGLPNLEVMKMVVDKEDALWVALYDGIARLEIQRSFSTFSKQEGLQSSVEELVRWKGRLIAATMIGLFEFDPGEGARIGHFQRMQNSEEYYNCWMFEDLGDQLYVPCIEGILRLELIEGTISGTKSIWDKPSWSIKRSPTDSTHFFVGSEEGVILSQMRAGSLEVLHREELSGAVVEIHVDPAHVSSEVIRLWALTIDNEVYQVNVYDQDHWMVKKMGSENGLEGRAWTMELIEQTLLVNTDRGIFRSDLGENAEQFGRIESLDSAENLILGVDRQNMLWLEEGDQVMLVDILPDGGISRSKWFPPARIHGLQEIESIFQDNSETYWVGHGRGIARIEGLNENQFASTPPLLIRSVSEIAGDSISNKLEYLGKPIKAIPFEKGSLRFEYAAQFYDFPEKTQYRVWLEGLQPTWQPWSAEHFKEFTNLREGHYTFHAQAKHVSGVVSDVSSVSFDVLPPWYREKWAYLLWVASIGLILTGLVSGTSSYMTRALKRRNLALESTVARRTADIKEKKVALEDANEELHAMNANLLRTNRMLTEQGEQLREALEANKEILGVTAHDLKNPLGGIIGLADIVLDDAKEGPQAAYESVGDNLVLLKEEAERMLQIIIGLLDKHRQGEAIELKKEKVILGDIVSSVLRWNQRMAQEKEITLHYDARGMFIVEVDIVSIQRVFDNLVSNAIKYSPFGSNVWVEIRDESITEQHVIRVLVRDEGPGLSEEDKKKAFRKMQRLSAKPTGGEHSTGLGLYIAKNLVEAHGGEIGVESTHGAGASFWFTLPVSFDLNQDHEQEVIDRAQIKISGIGNLE